MELGKRKNRQKHLHSKIKDKTKDTTRREEQIESSSSEEVMRMSCNGCRVLRKACGNDCVISPCLNWITNPFSQSHATLFLAKFYGRAGLLNLLVSGPILQRPAIFRSLLYEACGRIVDPVYGSVGLLHEGNWQRCQSAVDAVLRGNPISSAANRRMLNDVRHVSKDESLINPPGSVNVKKTRARSKRTVVKTMGVVIEPDQDQSLPNGHRSSLSHQSDGADDVMGADIESKRVGVEIGAILDTEEVLELTLAVRPIKKRRHHSNGEGGM